MTYFITALLLRLAAELIALTLPVVLTHTMAANNCNSVLTSVLIFCSRESLCKLSKNSFFQIKRTQLNVKDCNEVILVEGGDVIYDVESPVLISHEGVKLCWPYTSTLPKLVFMVTPKGCHDRAAWSTPTWWPISWPEVPSIFGRLQLEGATRTQPLIPGSQCCKASFCG